MANGMANLHNARRARVPVINIVGDHATYHSQYDAPLNSDIETVARTFSGWTRRPALPEDIGPAAAAAVAAAIESAELHIDADPACRRIVGRRGVPAEPRTSRPE